MSRTAAEPENEQEHAHDHQQPAAAPAAPAMQVGAAGDRYEQAADRAADQALRRLAETGELGGEGSSGGAGRAAGAMGLEGGAVDADTSRRIASSSGSAMPTSLRRSMEGAFGGASFGGVRLHTGPSAAALSSQLGAQAFTVGSDVFLGAGTPALDSRQGQHLLAHELAHTQQDGGGAHRSVIRRNPVQSPPAPGKFGSIPGFTPGMSPELEEDDAVSRGGDALETASVVDELGGVNDHMTALNDIDGGSRGTLGSDFDQSNLTYAGGAVAGLGLIFAGVKGWREGFKGPEDAWAATVAATNVASTMGGVAKEAQGGDGEKVEGSDEVVGAAPEITQKAAEVLEGIAGIVNTIQAAYEAVKAIIKAIDGNGLENGDVKVASVIAVQKAVGAGKAALEMVNTFMSAAGTITAPMLSAVPGLGIAIGALDILANGVALGIAYVSWDQMRTDKRAAKAEIFTALGITNTKTWGGLGNKSAVLEAQRVLDDVNSTADQIAAAKSYQMSRELQVISGKRIKRNMLNIATTLPGVAGDIAILSGAGAAVGAGLKIGGAGAKGLAVLVRTGKQAYYDYTADADKSTAAKRAKYDKIIMEISTAMVDSETMSDPDKKLVKQEKLVQQLTATGMTLRNIEAVKKNSKPPTDFGKNLWKAWIGALKNRDGA